MRVSNRVTVTAFVVLSLQPFAASAREVMPQDSEVTSQDSPQEAPAALVDPPAADPVARPEVARQPRPRIVGGMLRGAGHGTLIGLSIGAIPATPFTVMLSAALAGGSCTWFEDVNVCAFGATGAGAALATGAVVGAVVGAIVGATRRTEVSEPVRPAPRVGLMVAPTPDGGWRAGLSFSF